MLRPLKIIAPQGTIVNGVMPAASSMRGVTGFRIVDALFGALAQFLPERVFACGEGGNSLVIIGGEHQGAPYVFYELISGTWGGRPDRDGNDGLCNVSNVASNIPIEMAESEYPVRIEQYGLANDSAGGGKHRGGMAVERTWQLLAGEAQLTIRSDRRDHPPYGLAGGHSGQGSTNQLESGDDVTELPTFISTTMQAGDRLYHRQPGGGGWGPPAERDPRSVAADVRDERVSLAAAQAIYGVVIDPQSFEVDEAATAKLRAKLE